MKSDDNFIATFEMPIGSCVIMLSNLATLLLNFMTFLFFKFSQSVQLHLAIKLDTANNRSV